MAFRESADSTLPPNRPRSHFSKSPVVEYMEPAAQGMLIDSNQHTKNLRVVHLLLGHTQLESTMRYLGIQVDDALEMAEQTEI
jgi:hypothetical protein